MKKIIFLLFIPILCVYSTDRTIEIGDKFWSLSESSNIVKVADKSGKISLSIRDNEYFPDIKTIFLMHFNGEEKFDATGRFRVSNIRTSDKIKKLGKGAAFFNSSQGPAILDTEGKRFFPDRIYSGDFTVEFWLYSKNTSDGESYFLYENYTDTGDKVLPQLFRCYLEDRKITWEIKNLFLPHDKKDFSLVLRGEKRIIPRKWSHHLLRYSSKTGLIEYLCNGIPESSSYVNSKGLECSEVYPFYTGKNSRIIMGGNFTGALDEFRIQGDWINRPELGIIGHYTAFFMSDLIDLKHSKSRIFNISIKDFVPEGTDIKYYYHLSDSPHIPDPLADTWKKITKSNMAGSGGRFLYIKGVLFSDGDKTVSPSVNTIKIEYDEKNSPYPPSVVRAEELDGKLVIRWSAVPDSDIDGYHVYIGEKPGKYFGTKNIKSSPLDAGKKNKLVIDNLENGRVYYIAVCSYHETSSPTGIKIKKSGRYSSEIIARPAAGRFDD